MKKISKYQDGPMPRKRSLTKILPKNGRILTKIGIHIEQISDYYHAKFYQNQTTLRQLIITESCPILIKFCEAIVRSLVYMHTNFRQNRTIFWPIFFHGGCMHDGLKNLFRQKVVFCPYFYLRCLIFLKSCAPAI